MLRDPFELDYDYIHLSYGVIPGVFSGLLCPGFDVR